MSEIKQTCQGSNKHVRDQTNMSGIKHTCQRSNLLEKMDYPCEIKEPTTQTCLMRLNNLKRGSFGNREPASQNMSDIKYLKKSGKEDPVQKMQMDCQTV